VNYLLVSEQAFDKKIEEYDKAAFEIYKLTHGELIKLFNEYFKSLDPGLLQTKDDIELNLIGPNRLSNKDIEFLAMECLRKADAKKKQVSEILENDFGIELNK